MKLTNKLEENEKMLDDALGLKDAFDIGKRNIYILNQKNIVYTATFLVNSEEITQILLNYFQTNDEIENDYFQYVLNNLSCINVSISNSLKELTNAVFNGLVVILVNDSDKGIIIDLRKYPQRGLSEPDTEKIVRGSKEGFSENIAVNIGLIRRRIKSGNLAVLKMEIGTYSKTLISVVYLKDKVNKEALDECLKRLNKIKVEELTMTDKALVL